MRFLRLLVALLAIPLGAAQVSIVDTLTNPDGTGWVGRLVIQNQQMTSASGVTIVRAERTVLVEDGALSITLEANTGADPSGTSYTVRYNGKDGAGWVEFWVVPATGPVEVNEIRVATVPTPALTILLTQLAQGGATSGQVLAWDGSEWGPSASAASGITSLNGETGATQLFAKVNDTNVTLAVSSSGDTHTFTIGWTGLLGLARGGTGADLSATGGANQFLRQSSTGAAVTVSGLTDADVPNDITVDLATEASALATDPDPCGVGDFVTDIAADGTLTCDTPAGATISGAEGDVLCRDAAGAAVPCVTGSFFYSGGTLHFTPAAGKFRLPQTADQTNPTLQFGDGDTGFWEEADDVLAVSLAGALKFKWQVGQFRSNVGSALTNEVPSATNPTVQPLHNDLDTGVGTAGADILSLIAGGVEGIRITESGSAITNTFNGTSTFASGDLVTKNSTPAAATGACVAQSIWADADFIYVCVASGDIRRVGIATW